jgi:hypothetical protein
MNLNQELFFGERKCCESAAKVHCLLIERFGRRLYCTRWNMAGTRGRKGHLTRFQAVDGAFLRPTVQDWCMPTCDGTSTVTTTKGATNNDNATSEDGDGCQLSPIWSKRRISDASHYHRKAPHDSACPKKRHLPGYLFPSQGMMGRLTVVLICGNDAATGI